MLNTFDATLAQAWVNALATGGVFGFFMLVFYAILSWLEHKHVRPHRIRRRRRK